MKADAASTLCAFVTVSCIVGIVLMGASGCETFGAYVPPIIFIILAVIISIREKDT